MKKLLVVGSDSIHVYNFIELVKEYFDEVLLLTDISHREYNVNVIGVDFYLGFKSLITVQKIKAITKEFSPTVIHLHQANSYALLTLVSTKNMGVKKILTAWGSDILINPFSNFLFKKMTQYILNNIDMVTADSYEVLNKAQTLVDKKLKLYNINFGVDIATCQSKKENIIYSNRLHKSLYNIDKIIISFSKFSKLNNNWKLIIAGIGEETDNLKHLVRDLKLEEKVDFVGWVNADQNYQYYCKSTVYVSIPQSDSVSLSLVESVICGCIPFVSDLPANRELIYEKIGFIENDLENIDFLKYKKIDMDKFQIRQTMIKEYFSKEFNQKKYIELYEKNNEL